MALRRVGDMLASKYRIEALLGTGGMGDVYRATNTHVDRVVAIKLLHLKHVADPELLERFVREARVANIVRHPNVVDVLDVDRDDDGSPFIVQEFLHGEDLAHYMRNRGRLTLDDIRDLVVPIIDAVAAAHLQGIIHRDIKPANVFLATERMFRDAENPTSSRRRSDPSLPQSGTRVVPKLLDFGISKLRSVDVRATDVGVVMGTPGYMAPELLHGVRNADARSDVWALGVMLFELLAGRRPYLAKGPAIYVAIATTDPPLLSDVAPDVDLGVAEVVSRCLRRSVEERFSSATDLAAALSAALDVAQRRAPTISTEPIPELAPIVPDLESSPTLAGTDPTVIDVDMTVETLPSRGVERPRTELMSSAPSPRSSAAPAQVPALGSSSRNEALPQPEPTRAAPTLALAQPQMSQPPPSGPAPRSARARRELELDLPPSSSGNRPSSVSQRAPPAASIAPQQLRHIHAQQNESLLWLGGLLVLGISAIVVTGVLLAVAARAGGWPIVRPFVESRPQIAAAVQVGVALVAGALGTQAFRGALRRWAERERGPAIAYAGTCGALVFAALELLRALW